MDRRPVRQARLARLRQLLEEAGGPKALSRISGTPDTHFTAITKGRRDVGDELADHLEEVMGRPRGWMDTPPEGEAPSGVSRQSHAIEVRAVQTPPLVPWESLMRASELPREFACAMPDDALAPRTPRGTVLVFCTGIQPHPGWGVLIEDSTGQRYIRRYTPAAAGRWIAAANHPDYVALDSERDGLRILAVATHRQDGAV